MSDKKTLTIKRVFAWTIYDSLRQTPPKDYPTTAEIKSTIGDVLPALKEHVSFYVEMKQQAMDLAEKFAEKLISDEQSKQEVEKINTAWKAYNKEHGNEQVLIVLDEEGFKTLKSQFDREQWGKKWVVNIEEFGELLAAFAAVK